MSIQDKQESNETNETAVLAEELIRRLEKMHHSATYEGGKLYTEHQIFWLDTETKDFSMNDEGYTLPASLGADAAMAFITYILREKSHYKNEAVRFVQQIGIRPNLHGYHFLIMAICLALENRDPRVSVSSSIYPVVADAYQVDVRCVERNIRHAVSDAYYNNPEQLHSPFYYKVGRPYDSELIALAVELIRYNKL